MKFMITYDWAPDAEARAKGFARFKKIAGATPKGVKLLGRWTRADLGGGYVIVEADDPRALGAFSLEWSDLMDLSISPVIEDADLAELIRKAK